MKVYIFEFEDGYYCYCKGMSRQEIVAEERKHGKLIRKERVE